MKPNTLLSINIPGEITTNSNREKIHQWRDSMERTLASLHFSPIHNKKLSVSLKFWIQNHRLQNRRNDLDNLTKPVLDSMKKMQVIEDDAFIYHLDTAKFPTQSNEEMQLVVKEWRAMK